MKFSGYQFLLPIKDLDGKEIAERDEFGVVKKEGDKNKVLTVKAVLRTALVSTLKEFAEDETKKFDAYQLASKIMNLDPEQTAEITAEQITVMKKKVSLCWGIEIYGFIVDLLEGKNTDYKPAQDGEK